MLVPGRRLGVRNDTRAGYRGSREADRNVGIGRDDVAVVALLGGAAVAAEIDGGEAAAEAL